MSTRSRIGSTIACLITLAIATPAHAGRQNGRLDIYWVDVEGGAATLIITPAGESILIDTGNPSLRDPDRIVRVLSQQAGLRQIDHLIVTHYHLDHYGGASILGNMVPIKTLYDNGLTNDMPEPNPERQYLNLKCDRRKIINPGDQIPLKKKQGQVATLSLVCQGTRKEFFKTAALDMDNQLACSQHKPKDRDGTDNARSIVMLLKFGNFEFFDAGDLTWNQEYRLFCPQNPIDTVDVYQVTHHGLDSSNNPVALQSLRPTVAIMNNGATKGCKPEVFANLSETKSLQAIYQVHKNLRPDGVVNNVPDEYIANHGPEEQCEGNYIKLSVDWAAKTYTVSIPVNGHERTFETR